MYPWRDPNGFDSEPLYSYEDAPDAILITINDEPFNAEKYSESGFIAYSGSWGGGTITILEGEDVGSNWLLYSVDVPGDPSGQSNSGCLIGSYTVGDAGSGGAGSYTTIVEDQFADSYNVYNNSAGLNVGTADRLDVCTWGIPDIESGYKLFIKYNPSGSNAFKWTIETAGNIFVKAAPQKSPAGNYEFMGITIYTVS